MKSAIITPDHASIELPIPESFIGKKVEVTYTIEEVMADATVASASPERKKASDFKGILSKERAEELQQYIKESRQAWNNRI